MVAIVAFTDQFEARHAVAEVKPFDHAQFLEQVHGPINRHEVAKSFWQGRENLLVCERMAVLAKGFQDGLARPRNPALALAQAVGQISQLLPPRL